MRIFKFTFLLIPALLSAQSPSDVGRRALDLLFSEKYAELVKTFTPEMQAGLTETVLRERLGPQIKSFGPVEKIEEPRVTKAKGYDVVVVPVRFLKFAFDFELAVSANQKIGGLHLTPAQAAWQPPAYNKPDLYREREVTIGSDMWKLAGILSLPVGKDLFPV